MKSHEKKYTSLFCVSLVIPIGRIKISYTFTLYPLYNEGFDFYVFQSVLLVSS